MGFTEILLIAVAAIIFLGPDKLPSTLVEIAKFIRNTKNYLMNAKQSIEEEINIAELKKEALSYKQQLEEKTAELDRTTRSNTNVKEEFDELSNTISQVNDSLKYNRVKDDEVLEDKFKSNS